MSVVKSLFKITRGLVLVCIIFGASCVKNDLSNLPNNTSPIILDEISPGNIMNFVFRRNSNKIMLSWSNPTDVDFSQVLILRSESSISDAPEVGKSYVNVDLIGGSKVMYHEEISTFTDIKITEGVTYFYKIFAYDSSFNYASGVEFEGGTISPISPKNVINSRFLNLNNEGITLAWSNPIDANFYKILILRSENSISYVPTRGQDYANFNSIGSLTMVYNSNATTFKDSGAGATVASTHYYYKLFAYDSNFNYASGIEISGGGSKADHDGDGLIEIYTAEMLDNMRHDLVGASYKSSAAEQARGNVDGCPNNVCNGYELTAHIDLLNLLDANRNGEIDTMMIGIDTNADGDTTDNSPADGFDKQVEVIDTRMGMGKDTSWVPIGDSNTNAFTGIFEGNNHTIANLWVNIDSSTSNVYAGLFGFVKGAVEIHNVGIISGSVFASSATNSFSGGLVGYSDSSLTIINSYFSGSGEVSSFSSSSSSSSSFSYSGGLVGYSVSALTIIKCYFSGLGGVFSSSSSSSSFSYSGGLVGYSVSALTIIKCYFSGSGGVSSSSSSSSSSYSYSGGLVGYSGGAALTITNSYFSDSGGVFSSSSSFSYSGGLVGYVIVGTSANVTLKITNSYFSGSGGVSSSSSFSYSGGLVGYSVSVLMIVNSYFSGLGGVSSFSSSSSSSSRSGGLVGYSGGALTIINSYFNGSGGVSSSSSSSSYSGGLVGSSDSFLTIVNSYFSGSGGVSSSSSSFSYSGGLVGSSEAALTIINSYFSGSGGMSSFSSSSYSGGLLGFFSSTASLMVMRSYWNIDAPQSVGGTNQDPKRAQGDVESSNSAALVGESDTVEVVGTTGLTLVQLQAISNTDPDGGLSHSAADNIKAWDLGSNTQLPAVKLCIPTIATNGVTDWATCASYGALLPGQR